MASSKIVFGIVPILLLLAGPALAQQFGIGRAPTAAELAASSITIYPDGTGLPVGHGDAKTGAQLFTDNCAACHGEGAKGGISAAPNLLGTKGPDVSAWDRGTGGDGFPTKAPYATLTWDFIHRGMPLGNEGTLTADQVYSLTAYLFAINKIIPEDMVLDQDNLAKVKMPMQAEPSDVTGVSTWAQVHWVRPGVGTQRLKGYPY